MTQNPVNSLPYVAEYAMKRSDPQAAPTANGSEHNRSSRKESDHAC